MTALSPLDALVIFGYGPVERGPTAGSGALNRYGRLNALAAGLVYRSRSVGLIVPTGGRTGGDDRPSEAELIARRLRRKFGVPASRILLEEKATDTLFNVAHVANLLDRSPAVLRTVGFLALGLHLPRVREICAMMGLEGELIAAEEVVAARSARHRRLLEAVLQPGDASYARMLADQERGLRGLRELPEYWLPPLAVLENPARRRAALGAPRARAFLRERGVDVDAAMPDALREWLGRLERRFPS